MRNVRPMREVIAKAIRGRPTPGEVEWEDLSTERREGWMADADRVMLVLRNEMWFHFCEFALEEGGVEWIANEPDDLWRDFFDDCINNNGPSPIEFDRSAFR